jgi:arylsulfatase A-like enzyme
MILRLSSYIILSLISTVYLVAERVPNIVLILCDDLGYSDLSCYGNTNYKTANIDRLAKEGQKWTEFYSASHICSPSRAAILTGEYPVRTGTSSHVFFEWSAEGLPTDSLTIPEVLQSNGYNTFLVGKWHLGHREGFLPKDHGFDWFYGIPYSNDMRVDPEMKVADSVNFREGMTLAKMRTKGSKVQDWVPLMQGNAIIEYPVDQTTLTQRYTEKSIELIKQNKEQPFFLMISHHLPHIPIYVSKPFQNKYEDPYANAICEIDDSVGQIINALKSLELDENTIVVFTSDNGPNQTFEPTGGTAYPLKGSKFFASEGGQKVPAIFWCPNKIKKGSISGLGSTLDFFNTFISLTGSKDINITAQDSHDLSPVLYHGSNSPRSDFFYFSSFIPPRGEIYAVRKGDWKAHFFTSHEPHFSSPDSIEKHPSPLLYNLKEDPGETYNLAEKYPNILQSLIEYSENFSTKLEIAPDRYSKKILSQERPEWAQ